MKTYSPGKFRPLSWLSLLLRGIAYVLRHWLVILIAVLVISPVGPHLLVWYTYKDYGAYKDMNDCVYLGGRGLVKRHDGDNCPVIVIIDRRIER
ncbi:hypothetical protein C8R30_10921 [Nitrosomonas nitrosa]|jgi:hypothetical protein|uniref:hypothetical protein n=1 Tax=Nitrosomonas nitrosa TaxID=52442 RepID=UPI000D31745B|nr:hypothetical protein [Nitrosomonas nitrosa]PTQ98744.1 hypothetical protein C8R30_10921 [Nitrosomonas nitrosa]